VSRVRDDARGIAYNTLLNIVKGSPRGSDGDHPNKDPKEAEKVKKAQETTKDVKRIQTMVRNLLFQAQDILPNSPGKNPVLCTC